MKIKYTTLIILSIFLLGACVKEDYFGESEYANLKKISLSNQSKNAEINPKLAKVRVEIPGGIDLSEIIVQAIELSSFASTDLLVGDTINIQNPYTFTIISENGTERLWTIEAFVASETPQLDNGDLNLWYETNTGYYEPGESANNTIWATGNKGSQLLNRLATTPIDLGNGNVAAKMTTLHNGPLGSLFNTPISAGSLFTGIFNADNIDPADPSAATEFGTPFSGRPHAIKLKYSYKPGEENKDKNEETLNYSDAADIYALLEVRINGVTERLATAWLRTEETQNELIEITIPFNYGALDNSFPEYMIPENGLFVEEEKVEYILPTHIVFVASSSFDGAQFSGAVGSELIIDDIELLY